MEIHFKSAHTKDVEDEVTPKITGLAQRKLIALKKYIAKSDAVTQVYVELGKVAESHQSGMIWRAQINMDVKGKRYNATAVAERLEGAVDTVVRELEAELRKTKKRNESVLRKSGGALKSIMRGFQAR